MDLLAELAEAARDLGEGVTWAELRAQQRAAAVAAHGARRSWPRCGATTRAGSPCLAPPTRASARPRGGPPGREAGWYAPRNGRCRLHGGLSTGPRTPAGRALVGRLARERWDAGMLAAGHQLPPGALVTAVVALVEAQGRRRARLELGCTIGQLRRLMQGRPEAPTTIAAAAAAVALRAS